MTLVRLEQISDKPAATERRWWARELRLWRALAVKGELDAYLIAFDRRALTFTGRGLDDLWRTRRYRAECLARGLLRGQMFPGLMDAVLEAR
jgi:hypothetical protein